MPTISRLYYGSIKLVPYNNGEAPYNRDENADKWHVPGCEIRTTAELIRLANLRDIPVVLSERCGVNSKLVRLN